MILTSPNLTNAVSATLHRASASYSTNPGINGLQPDFVVEMPDNKKIILETKSWEPTAKNQERAVHQAQQFKEATGADEAYIIMDKADRNRESEGLISLDQLEPLLEKLLKATPEKVRQNTASAKVTVTEQTVFAAMPFEEDFDDVYFVAMAPAARSVDASCIRLDQEHFQGDVISKVKTEIERSKAVVADLSGSNPNVLYEIGYAHALNKPTIHICSTPIEHLPFDVKTLRTYEYAKGQTYKLKNTLIEILGEVLQTS